MANLSNINGKFVVEQTTGYVGVGTTDPNYPIEVLNASAEIALNASGGSIYRLRSDSTDSFRINKNGVGDRLVIAGNGNATFAGTITSGNVTVNGSSRAQVVRSSNDQVVASFTCDGNAISTIGFKGTSGANDYNTRIGVDGNDFVAYTVNSVRMRIDTSGNTTFAGTVKGTIAKFDTLNNNANSANIIYRSGTDTIVGGGSPPNKIYVQDGGNVGIGTTGPSTQLHIDQASNDRAGGLYIERNGSSYGLSAFVNLGGYGVIGSNGSLTTDILTMDLNSGNVGIGAITPTSKLTLPQEEENGFKIEFTGGSYSSGISTVDQAGSGLYIGANSYVNNSGSVTYKDSALDSNGIYFDAWNGNNMKFYTALAGTPQQRMSIAGDGAVVINGTTNLVGNLRVGGSTLATSSLHVYNPFGNGGSLWSIGENATFAYTAHKQWTSLSGSPTPTAAYYNIGTIGDSRSAIIVIKTAAHSCATILVSRGYGPSNVARFQVLSSTKNQNSNYANITGIQISGGGAVDIKLQWSVGPLVAIEIAVYGLGFTIANTLSVSGASTGANYPLNVLWQHDLPADAGSAMVPGQFRVQGNIVNPGTWGTTTGSAANMHVDSNGTFFRSTSSLKYKKDVRNYDKGLNEVMQLKPKYYKGKDDGDVQFAGLIAEDVHDLGLNEFVQYAEDGTPDALAYPNMIALLTKAIQELKAEIELLKNK